MPLVVLTFSGFMCGGARARVGGGVVAAGGGWLLFEQVPPDVDAMYIDLAPVLGTLQIVDGSHDNSDLVRTATISQKHKTMTLVLRKNKGRQPVGIRCVTCLLFFTLPSRLSLSLSLSLRIYALRSVEALPAGTTDRDSPLKLTVAFNITVGASNGSTSASETSSSASSPPPAGTAPPHRMRAPTTRDGRGLRVRYGGDAPT